MDTSGGRVKHTVKGDNAEDEDKRENKDDDGVDLEAGRLISVKSCKKVSV